MAMHQNGLEPQPHILGEAFAGKSIEWVHSFDPLIPSGVLRFIRFIRSEKPAY
jgi:hypothetical protein